MAHFRYTAQLSPNSLRKMQKQIDEYRKDLPNRVAKALNILADKGVKKADEIARRSGTFGDCVIFEKVSADIKDTEVTAIMRGTNLGIEMSWQQADGSTKSAMVNALLMLEFGSGAYADDEHRGTFPDQTHSFDAGGWWFKPVGSNEWVHSFGYKPKKPMLEAYLEMEQEILSAFNEAFK